jgi:hypothetical protein
MHGARPPRTTAPRPAAGAAVAVRRRPPGRLLDAAAIGLLVLFLAAALPSGLWHACNQIGHAVDTSESREDARARVYGEDYSRAIDRIRAALAPGEGYILVEGGRPGSGGVYWVRYDLAPRPAANVGPLADLTSGAQLRRRLSANLRHVVVAFDTRKPPRLYERYQFVEEIERRARKGPG